MTTEKKPVGRPMGKLHQEDVRKKIQIGQLIKVLENHALSDDEKELSASRLKAIQILLNKSLPDLSSIQLVGDDDRPLTFEIAHTIFGRALDFVKMDRQSR
jgi:hypothetical protein